ncbi:hypothetical protein [Amycolatopsis tolypomycina]|uniref:hypothetical protein n=1 Tax=Amycolatopsis tolypomycina TaxID=208445 RepID=UPI00115F85AD|nr:hypothetical protein [Amycolatopsis tolypomycina]
MAITMRSVGDATMTVKKPPDDHTTAKLFTETDSCWIVRNIPTFGGSAVTTSPAGGPVHQKTKTAVSKRSTLAKLVLGWAAVGSADAARTA